MYRLGFSARVISTYHSLFCQEIRKWFTCSNVSVVCKSSLFVKIIYELVGNRSHPRTCESIYTIAIKTWDQNRLPVVGLSLFQKKIKTINCIDV